MKLRSTVAAALAITLTLETSMSAHAQEHAAPPPPEVTSPSWLVTPPSPLDLRTRLSVADVEGLGGLGSTRGGPLSSPFAPTPAKIRLSQGAITAIIIGGVVLIILVAVGVATLGKPKVK